MDFNKIYFKHWFIKRIKSSFWRLEKHTLGRDTFKNIIAHFLEMYQNVLDFTFYNVSCCPNNSINLNQKITGPCIDSSVVWNNGTLLWKITWNM